MNWPLLGLGVLVLVGSVAEAMEFFNRPALWWRNVYRGPHNYPGLRCCAMAVVGGVIVAASFFI